MFVVQVEVTTAVAGVKGGASDMQTTGLTKVVTEQGSYKLRMDIPQAVEDIVETVNEKTMLKTVNGGVVGHEPWVAGDVQTTTRRRQATVAQLDEKALEAEGDFAGGL